MQVIFSYFHELGRSVSIDDACTEYFPSKLEEKGGSLFSVVIVIMVSRLLELPTTLKLQYTY